jgi:hypothetical protein
MHQERSGYRKEKEEKTPEEGHYQRRYRGLNERTFMESRFVMISWDSHPNLPDYCGFSGFKIIHSHPLKYTRITRPHGSFVLLNYFLKNRIDFC